MVYEDIFYIFEESRSNPFSSALDSDINSVDMTDLSAAKIFDASYHEACDLPVHSRNQINSIGAFQQASYMLLAVCLFCETFTLDSPKLIKATWISRLS
jgi:hypothetical protein